jgi:hypothetical protein
MTFILHIQSCVVNGDGWNQADIPLRQAEACLDIAHNDTDVQGDPGSLEILKGFRSQLDMLMQWQDEDLMSK